MSESANQEVGEALRKLAGLAIAVEIAEHVKTAGAKDFLARISNKLKGWPGKAKAERLSKAEGALAGTSKDLSQTKGKLEVAMSELAKAEGLARGAVYAGALGIPGAGITGYAYGKEKGKEKGKEEFIQELLGG